MSKLIKLMNEDSPFVPTNQSQKQGWWFLTGVMIGCTICVPVFVMGADMAHQIPYTQFILAAFLGGILAAGVALITGIVGQRTGLPTAMLAKIAFGTNGSVLANLAMAISSIGWFGIQTAVFSAAFVQLSSQVWGVQLNPTIVTILSGLIMSTTAVIGYRGLGKLSYVAVPLLMVLLILPLYVFFIDGKLASLGNLPSSNQISLGAMIAMVAGAYGFASTMPDVTRFMKRTRATTIGIVSNYVLAYPLLLILTGSVALAAGQNDYMQVMLGLGFGSLAIIVLLLATWTTNDTNVYTGALSLNLFLPKWPRWQIAVAVGVFGTLFAVMGILENFTAWLIFSGNLFAPMAGVYVADYWFNQSRYSNTTDVPAFRVPQLLAWLGGLAVGSLTTTPENMGLGWTTLTTIPMIDAMLAAALIQISLHAILERKRVLAV
jgi:cytosine permease